MGPTWLTHPLLLSSLGVLPLLGLLSLWDRWRRRHDLARVGSLGLVQAQLVGPRDGRLRGLCRLLALLLLCIGMAGPRWGRDWEQAVVPGRDLLVVLDCSRSMWAETPSRLERARRALLDLSDALEKRGGHRVGLVLCAGRARLACPLTHDYDHLRDLLVHLDPPALDVELSSTKETSGTRLGRGIHEALLARDPRFAGGTDILLLSDGDDPAHDGEWRAGALEAAGLGVPVHTVGLGDPDTPTVIPVAGEPLRYEGQEVTTRLDEEPLREMARLTRGMYVPAHTRGLPLGELYLTTIAHLPTHQDSDDVLPVARPRYRWLLAPALALLALTIGWPAGARWPSLRWPRRLAHAALLGSLLLVAAGPSAAPDTLLAQGNAAFARGDYAAAAQLYEQAQARSTDPERVAFNLAAARYHLAQGSSHNLEEAEALYRCCLEPDSPYRARALAALGHCLLRQGAGRDRAALEAAVSHYDELLKSPSLDPDLASAARYGRARAVLLALQLATSGEKPAPDRSSEDHSSSPPADNRQPPTDNPEDQRPADQASSRPDSPSGTAVRPDPGQEVRPTDQPPAPGQGNLPPISDRSDAPPLTPEQAARHLDLAAQRIADERRAHQQSLPRSLPPSIRDW